MDRFGYFVTERPGYDEAYGLVEPARYRFANRHNLWQQSHLRDEAGETVACTADADCADGRGSVCDLDLGRANRSLTEDRQVQGACTLPFRDRAIRPVVYHLTANFPTDLLPEMRMLESEWNATFVETVDSLRENECNTFGDAECASERGRDAQILAIQVLTDPTTYFLGRDTDSDIRRYQLNFANTFGPSMSRFFGAILAEDWSTFAAHVGTDGALRYPDALEVAQGDMPGTPISPNASFSIQLYAAVFGMALIPQTYDQDFLNRSRIWVRGGAEEVEVDPSMTLIEYVDPESGLTYVAVSYEDERGVEHGVGAQLIGRALALQTRADGGDASAASELDSYIDNLDLVRMLTWQLGFGAQP